MAMKPLAELIPVVRATSAKAFADRLPDQDVAVVELWAKGRSYTRAEPFDPAASVAFIPRNGTPIPVGRDARALVQLDHQAVSRLHAVLAYGGGGWKVMDRSSNGTFLGPERLPSDRAVPLPYEAPLRMGKPLVVRVFKPEEFHAAAQGVTSVAPPPPRPMPDVDPKAATAKWQSLPQDPPTRGFPAAPPPPPPARPAAAPGRPPAAPAPVASAGGDLDFDFADPAVPPPAAPPPAPAKGGGSDDIEFDFDFDAAADGRGGFA